MYRREFEQIYINGRFVTQKMTGVQRYALEIIRRFPKDRISLLSVQPVAVEYKVFSTIQKIYPFCSFGKRGVLGHAWEQIILPQLVSKNSLLWSPCGSGPLSYREQVVTVHDLAYLEHPQWFNPNFSRWYRFLITRLVHRVKHVIVVSEYTRQTLIKFLNINEDKVTVIANGVDESFSPKTSEEVLDVKNKLSIPGSEYILTLGSIEPRKNLQRLLVAWEAVQANLPDDTWLVVTGIKGNPNVFSKMYFKVPKRVYFTGYVEEHYLPALYTGARVFVYVSLYEGFGLPPLEAMACGTPVVTSNTTSLPEVVGDAAVLVNPEDPAEISRAILTLWEKDELREKLKEKGLKRSLNFSWDKTAQQTWKVLLDLAKA